MMVNYLLKPNYIGMTLIQLLLPISIFAGIGAEWYWWLVCLFFYFIYMSIGHNVGMHRYFCHRYFKMRNRPIKWFVTWAACCTGFGSPFSYTAIHNLHHTKYDTDVDVHGPWRGWKSLIYLFHRTPKTSEITMTRNLLRLSKEYGWLHEYYWLFVFGTGLAFYLIGGLNLFLFGWAMPASLALWAVSLILLLQHDKEGPNNSTNHMWFGFGERWHKNHHNNLALENHSDPGCKDWTYEITKVLRK